MSDSMRAACQVIEETEGRPIVPFFLDVQDHPFRMEMKRLGVAWRIMLLSCRVGIQLKKREDMVDEMRLFQENQSVVIAWSPMGRILPCI